MKSTRCAWVPENDDLYIRYHDKEWGVPIHEDRKLFELLMLEGFQAGLSWRTILYKRENFRHAFDHFNPRIIAGYDKNKIQSLLNDPGIIRNRLKILAAVTNAQAYLRIQNQFGSFDAFLWDFVGGTPIQNTWKAVEEIPAKTSISDKLSKDLKEQGFKFVGSTVCYAHMQSAGMVNDHVMDCFRYMEIRSVSI